MGVTATVLYTKRQPKVYQATASVVIDPNWETADVDVENNHYPRRIIPSRIEIFKSPEKDGFEHRDIMQDSKTKLEKVN